MSDTTLAKSSSLEGFDETETKELEEALAKTNLEPTPETVSPASMEESEEAKSINWTPIGGDAHWSKDGMSMTATYESPDVTTHQMWNAFTPWNAPKWQVRILYMKPVKENWKGSLHLRDQDLAFVGSGLSGPFATLMRTIEFCEEEDFLHSKSAADLPGSSKMHWSLTVEPLNPDGTGARASTTVDFKLSRPMRLLWPLVRKRFNRDTLVFRKALNRYLQSGQTSQYTEVDDMKGQGGIMAKIAQKLMKPPKLPETVEWDDKLVASTTQQRLDGLVTSRSDLLCMGEQVVPTGREGDQAPPLK